MRDDTAMESISRGTRGESHAPTWRSVGLSTGAYDQDELNFLGLPSETRLGHTEEPIALWTVDCEVRACGAQVELGWWDTTETRARASLRQGEVAGRLLAGRLLKEYGYRAVELSGAEGPLSLAWLCTCSQETLEAWKLLHPKHPELLQSLGGWLDDPNLPLTSYVAPSWSVSEWLLALAGDLSERKEAILLSRYMLHPDISERSTLEDLGRFYGLTREAIRQIGAKTIAKLGTGVNQRIARFYLDRELDRFCQTPPVVIRQAEFTEWFKSQMTWPERLLAMLAGASLDELSPRSRVLHNGMWLVGRGAGARAVRLAMQIEKHALGSPLPCPLTDLEGFAEDSDGDTVLKAALLLCKGVDAFDGHLLDSSARASGRLAIRLHERSLSLGARLSTSSLPSLVRSDFPGRAQGLRACLTAVRKSPHMFLELGEFGFMPIGGDPLALVERGEWAAEPSTAPDRATVGTLAWQIEEYLNEHGIAQLVNISRGLSIPGLPALTASSVGPIIALNPDRFVRVAPGVYGRRGVDLSAHRERLLSVRHARDFVSGCRAGHGLGTYSAWTSEMEHAWCEWARDANDPQLYRALLYYASPAQWSLAPAESAAWLREKSQIPGDELRSPRGELVFSELPTPDLFLATYVLLRGAGGFSIFAGNRLLGRRPSVNVAWSLVAFSIALGWLEEADHWQSFHRKSEAEDSLVADLFAEKAATGEVTWADDAGQELAARAISGLQAGRCQWLTEDARADYLSVLSVIVDDEDEATNA